MSEQIDTTAEQEAAIARAWEKVSRAVAATAPSKFDDGADQIPDESKDNN